MEQEYLWRNMPHHKNKYEENDCTNNTYPWECVDGCSGMKENYMEHGMNYMPVQNMGSKMYAYIYQTVVISLNKFMPSNSKMPKAISKDNFNLIVNDCMCHLTKHEKELHDMMKSRCIECETEERGFCPFCGGMLKSVVEVALITSLINGGCAFCF